MTSDLGLNKYLRHGELLENVIPTRAKTLDATSEGIPVAIKINVKGYEMMVLQGASRILQDSALKVICIETIGLGERYGRNDDEVLSQLKNYGFTPVNCFPYEKRTAISNENLECQFVFAIWMKYAIGYWKARATQLLVCNMLSD